MLSTFNMKHVWMWEMVLMIITGWHTKLKTRDRYGERGSHMKVKGLIVFMLIRFCFDIYINVQISIIKFVWHFIECAACFIEFSLIILATEFHSILFCFSFYLTLPSIVRKQWTTVSGRVANTELPTFGMI